MKFHLPYLRRLRRYTLAEPWSRSRAAGLAGMWIQESSPFSSSLDSLDTLFCRQSFPINSTQTHSLWMFCKSFGVAVFATLITGAQNYQVPHFFNGTNRYQLYRKPIKTEPPNSLRRGLKVEQ